MSEKLNSTSWKTSAAGIAAIVVAVGGAVQLLTDGNPNTNPDYNALVAALAAGIGLLFSRDNDKSSEEVGVKTKLESPKGKEQ